LAARFVRDEEAGSSNLPTPTGKRQVTDHIVTCRLYCELPVSDLGADNDNGGQTSTSGLSSNGTTASRQRYCARSNQRRGVTRHQQIGMSCVGCRGDPFLEIKAAPRGRSRCRLGRHSRTPAGRWQHGWKCGRPPRTRRRSVHASRNLSRALSAALRDQLLRPGTEPVRRRGRQQSGLGMGLSRARARLSAPAQNP
jgi:hypothetical protein